VSRAVRLSRELGSNLRARARAHPALVLALAVALVATLTAISVVSRQRGRTVARARELIALQRAAEARELVEKALLRNPKDPELVLLRARALVRTPGRAADGVDAYAAARATGPLDEDARADLVEALGRERSLADKAARLLRDEGDAAVPLVIRTATSAASGTHRLRALSIARDLGAEEKVDRAKEYGVLLSDPECDVRRAAARRLGEIGDPAALPRLGRAAAAKVETKGLFGIKKSGPACGAIEASEAMDRIQAARLPEPKQVLAAAPKPPKPAARTVPRAGGQAASSQATPAPPLPGQAPAGQPGPSAAAQTQPPPAEPAPGQLPPGEPRPATQ
jgi:serine/threonine-protein kinase